MNMPVILGLLVLFLSLLTVSAVLAKRRRWLAATVTAFTVLVFGGTVAFGWLGFLYRPALLPLLAVVTPNRNYTLGGSSIPLPPRTIQTGGCTSTGRWYYSRSPLEDVVGFYRNLGARVEVPVELKPVRITFKGVTFEATAISARESQLGVGCAVSY